MHVRQRFSEEFQRQSKLPVYWVGFGPAPYRCHAHVLQRTRAQFQAILRYDACGDSAQQLGTGSDRWYQLRGAIVGVVVVVNGRRRAVPCSAKQEKCCWFEFHLTMCVNI